MVRKQELDDGRKKTFGKKYLVGKITPGGMLHCFLRLRLKRLANRAKLLLLFFFTKITWETCLKIVSQVCLSMRQLVGQQKLYLTKNVT